MNSSNTVDTPFDLTTLFEDFDGEYEESMIVYGILLESHFETVADLINIDHSSPSSSSQPKSNYNTDALMQSILQPSSLRTLAQQQSWMVGHSPMINTPCLDSFNTPFTPAAASFMADSPMMATPYMDPLMNTTTATNSPNIFSTPMMDASSTPFMGATGMDLGCIEQYFTPAMDFAPDSGLTTMDPTQLAMGQQHQHQLQSQQQKDDDSLFPPLSHEEQQQLDGGAIDASSGNDMDLLFDDLFGSNEVFPSNEVCTTSTKRKLDEQNEDLPRPKQAKTTTTTVVPATANDRQFVCHICDRSFNRRFNLGTHIKTHNKDRKKPFACHLCSKSFDRKHDCERHVSTVHMGERLFTCEACQVSFSRRDALHRHQLQKHVN
ncbi:hypothetical protein [Absidia glauca]|uniref:C2H2-type domain-containing protein n=1 Tax=Absidia glauca TaxID=4829 RepID=A0A168SNM0_ABSGL|nr:hypothetical protein [Absidia glauca]